MGSRGSGCRMRADVAVPYAQLDNSGEQTQLASASYLSSPSTLNSTTCTSHRMSCLHICPVSLLLDFPLFINHSCFPAILFRRAQSLKVNVPKTASEAPSSFAVEPASLFPRNNLYLVRRLGRTAECFGADQRIDQLPSSAPALDHPSKWPSLACSGRSTPVSQSLLSNASCKHQRRN